MLPFLSDSDGEQADSSGVEVGEELSFEALFLAICAWYVTLSSQLSDLHCEQSISSRQSSKIASLKVQRDKRRWQARESRARLHHHSRGAAAGACAVLQRWDNFSSILAASENYVASLPIATQMIDIKNEYETGARKRLWAVSLAEYGEGIVSKAPGQIIRLATILHLFERAADAWEETRNIDAFLRLVGESSS